MRLFYWDFLEDLVTLKQYFDAYRIVAGETDTVIGLFARCSPETFQKLDEIKKRHYKPYIFLVSDVNKAKNIIDPVFHDLLHCVGSIVWPGPITIVIPASHAYAYATAVDGTIAIRVPCNEAIRSFLKHFDALFSTSANTHQNPIPKTIADIDPEIITHVDALVAFKESGEVRQPSTIIRVTRDTIEVIRGALQTEMINKLKRNGFNVIYLNEK